MNVPEAEAAENIVSRMMVALRMHRVFYPSASSSPSNVEELDNAARKEGQLATLEIRWKAAHDELEALKLEQRLLLSLEYSPTSLRKEEKRLFEDLKAVQMRLKAMEDEAEGVGEEDELS